MELQRVGPNVTVINCTGGARILFSYDVPRAAYLPAGGYIKTDRYVSRTTSQHVAEFCRGNVAKMVDQEIISKLAREVH